MKMANPEDIVINSEGVFCYQFDNSLKKVDVIFLKVSGRFTINKEIQEAVMSGKVIALNFMASLLPMDKGVYCYLDELIKEHLNELPILKQPVSFIIDTEEKLNEVYSKIDRYVLKSRSGMGGKEVLIAKEANQKQLDEWYEIIKQNLKCFIAQERIEFDKKNVLDLNNEWKSDYFDLRVFAVFDDEVVVSSDVMTRIADNTQKVNISSGGRIADTWVIKGELHDT